MVFLHGSGTILLMNCEIKLGKWFNYREENNVMKSTINYLLFRTLFNTCLPQKILCMQREVVFCLVISSYCHCGLWSFLVWHPELSSPTRLVALVQIYVRIYAIKGRFDKYMQNVLLLISFFCQFNSKKQI